ncbi:MAG: N-6 DNA methylase [Turneriella sp.]|nr:N-6 DNA methylase [Turneriella sp.]
MNSISSEIKLYYEKLTSLKEQSRLFREKDTERLFINLLESIATAKGYYVRGDYQFYDYGKNIKPDGTIFTVIGIPYGLYEAKDHKIDLSIAIEEKIKSGYPLYNIIFENAERAILYQYNKLVYDVPIADQTRFSRLLEQFFEYDSQEIQDFNRSLREFNETVPLLVAEIRKLFEDTKLTTNSQQLLSEFQAYCQLTINPNITRDDIREMIVQHLLTIDIFNSVFNEFEFEKYNALAKKLDEIIRGIFNIGIRKHILHKVHHFYSNVQRHSLNITDYGTKKRFLISFYENFLRAYNPKSADRLGIFYTPIEAVDFMIRSSDALLKRHFKKSISDKNIVVLDPCTGTGTFVSELIDYLFKNTKKQNQKNIVSKYLNEIYCNEISILPFYIANLSIEKMFFDHTQDYKIFRNIALLDTLDNANYRDSKFAQKVPEFDELEVENIDRIKRQNEEKISLIIGNPPYNANQKNENENNKNREYPEIDLRIKQTYIALSNSQKTKVYDMYSRFIRYATDRLGDDGIIAFITSNSFVNRKTYDGFRRSVYREFDYIYVINLGGYSIEKKEKAVGNIFGIKLGVAISFFIKVNNGPKKCELRYFEIDDFLNREEKLLFLKNSKITDLELKQIKPKGDYWLNTQKSNYDDYTDLQAKEKELGFFNSISNAVPTNRDYWVFDFEKEMLERKIRFFIQAYNGLLNTHQGRDTAFEDISIKWSRDLKNKFKKKMHAQPYNEKLVTTVAYRPFTEKFYYAYKPFSDVLTANHFAYYGPNLTEDNPTICISKGNEKFEVLATSKLAELAFLKFGNGGTILCPLYTVTNGQKKENINSLLLSKIKQALKSEKIEAIDVFSYLYAIFHHEVFRQENAVKLEREVPKVPIVKAFGELSQLGRKLFVLHMDYKKAKKYPIEMVKTAGKQFEVHCSANSEKSEIHLDSETKIINIPQNAFSYKIGNLSPLEWLLKNIKPVSPNKDRMENYKIVFTEFNTPANEIARYKSQKQTYLIELSQLVTIGMESSDLIQKISAFDLSELINLKKG